MQLDHFRNEQRNLPRAAPISIESNILTSIYGKLKYTLASFLLKLVCHVYQYICNYTFVMIKLQLSTFKIYQLNVISMNTTVKMII